MRQIKSNIGWNIFNYFLENYILKAFPMFINNPVSQAIIQFGFTHPHLVILLSFL